MDNAWEHRICAFTRKAALGTAAAFCLFALITSVTGIVMIFDNETSTGQFLSVFLILSILTLAFMIAELVVLRAFGAKVRREDTSQPHQSFEPRINGPDTESGSTVSPTQRPTDNSG